MITKDEILRFIPGLTPSDLRDLLASANSDPGEGAEWLPYYKLALARLAECCGLLRAMVGDEIHGANRERIYEAQELFSEHLLIAGVGPSKDAETIRTCKELAMQGADWFIDGKRGS